MVSTILLSIFFLPFSIPTNLFCAYGGQAGVLESGRDCTVEMYFGSLSEAITACAAMNGTLPVLHSAGDQQKLSATLKKTYGTDYVKWLKDHPDSDTTVWLGWKNGSWMDGTSVDYTGNLNKTGNYSELVLKRDPNGIGTWMEPLNNRSQTFCDYIYFPVPACSMKSNVNDVRFFYIDLLDKNCYAYNPYSKLVATNITFSQSQAICYNNLMVLPTILKYRENELIYTFVRQYTKQSHIFPFVWLNAKNLTSWMTGEEMKYTNFCKDFADRYCHQTPGNDPCLAMIMYGKNAGQWSWMDCSDKLFTVCQYRNFEKSNDKSLRMKRRIRKRK